MWDRLVQLVPSDTGAGREQASDFVTLSQGGLEGWQTPQ